MSALSKFYEMIKSTDIDAIRAGLIGRDMPIETPFGTKSLLYADYVASGRALKQIEQFVAEEVLPYYANSHTEASHCGRTMTRMREEARATIARLVNADDACHVVFTGSGATAGINRIVNLLNIRKRVNAGDKVVILSGPYEHHSNLLPWRETGAEIVEIPPTKKGGVDLIVLEAELQKASDADLVVGTFSAASNVTGVITTTDPVTRMLKRYKALAIWDYAGGAPYLPMDMSPSELAQKDAIIFSPHKFPGGPGASGIMVIRESIVCTQTPTVTGGGTVSFVSPWRHEYSKKVAAREEAGTPNVVGDIRAALVMLLKDAIGAEWILDQDESLRLKALSAWQDHPNLNILGQKTDIHALPIFSFQIKGLNDELINHQLFTRMLSDHLGIQARGGCACAGAYAHRLLGIDQSTSNILFERLSQGHELEKPGWVRLNLSYLHSDDEIKRILDGVSYLATNASKFAQDYVGDPATARFHVKDDVKRSA